MKKITLLFFLSMLCPMLCHQSMAGESFGTTYPIQETDLLQDIQNQLKKKEKSGELKRLQEQAIARSKNSILNPQRVAGVIRTTNPRQYLYDPSIVVDQDYKTPDGQIFAQRGQRFNPLTIMPLETPFLFFDAADPEQLTVAKSYLAKHPQIKLVLVGGSWSDAQKSLGHKVYFDQAGKLTQKFGIHQVPAFVSQKDLFLQIQELKMGEKP